MSTNMNYIPALEASITTDDIEKCITQNQYFLKAISENLNLGKTYEAAKYQELLHQNLLYLARLADYQLNTNVPLPSMACPPRKQASTNTNTSSSPFLIPTQPFRPEPNVVSSQPQYGYPIRPQPQNTAQVPVATQSYLNNFAQCSQPFPVYHNQAPEYQQPIQQQQHQQREVKYWTPQEHERFLEALEKYGPRDLKSISNYIQSRTPTQVRSHMQKYLMKLHKVQMEMSRQFS
eukprot:TRINITY_DN15307_c0_g1_i1.p1 TRINITY_DN15307_c0_g1~~TRINITY_DN15307_c0_g1_i1.p1  ORF type:complete len:234 (+),score=41.03 TRINITY_DN15307_c0_g1_i1:467-1168(+)